MKNKHTHSLTQFQLGINKSVPIKEHHKLKFHLSQGAVWYVGIRDENSHFIPSLPCWHV